jgi:AcrR family transcriptional regulator
MGAAELILQDGIPGVFAARQSRSIRNRDSFLKDGVEALGKMPFDEIKISQLAAVSGNSVGSFYTRFQDKEAFLRALRTYAVEAIDREHCAEFIVEQLNGLPPEEVLDALVDLLGAIFASRFRGVLRENYTRIMHADDPWAPIRTHAQQIVHTLHDSLNNAFPQYGANEKKTWLSFCFQMVVGVLQNDLVNDYDVLKLDDGTVLPGLKEALRAYMALPAPIRNT